MDKASSSSISETPLFRGPENDPIPLKEQKKIQIDIRRPIRPSKVSSGPIKRSIKDPQKVTLPRREKEGRKGLFDRDEIKNWKKSNAQVSAANSPSLTHHHHLSKASDKASTMRSQERKRDDLRERLEMESPPAASRRTPAPAGGSNKSSVHSRLGQRLLPSTYSKGGNSSVLERQEMERFRPDVKPWDVNPEFVPRGRNYYEHDTREDSHLRGVAHRGGGVPPKGRDRGGKSYARPRPYDSRNGAFRKHRSRDHHSDSTEWKHDRYTSGESDFHR